MSPPGNSRVHRQAINTPGHAHELTFSCFTCGKTLLPWWNICI
jgi:hypothetical protein